MAALIRGRSRSAEKHVLVVAMVPFGRQNSQGKGERLTEAEGHLSSTWRCWKVRLQIIPHQLAF